MNNSTIYENDYSNYSGWTTLKVGKTEEDVNAYTTAVTDKTAAEAGFLTSI
jgi:hypothetical protein